MGVQSDLAEIMFSDFLTRPRICALRPVWPCHPLSQVQNRGARFLKEIMLIFHQGADQSTDILDQVKANTGSPLIGRFLGPRKNCLNSSFFLNWCNVNPNKIMKWDQLWFRGFISIILYPFSRVFAISAFLKVIHAHKTPKRGGISGTLKITFPHIFFQILAIGTSHKVAKHPNVKGFLSK